MLELYEIQKRVASCALSEEASSLLLQELPACNEADVKMTKERVQAILKRINSTDEEKRDQIPSIKDILPKLEVEGMVFDLDEAYALAIFVERASELLKWLSKDSPAVLEELIQSVPDCSVIPSEVFKIIDRDGKLKDLPEFQAIKARIRTLHVQLDAAISAYSHNEETQYMLQSPLPSQKDGRIVMAVKANFKGRIKGIVHEVSSSGQTLFIEPVELVEKNNDMTMEHQNLRAAVHALLRALSKKIADCRHELAILHERTVCIETYRAKARYAFETKGHFAILDTVIQLKKARHPLLKKAAVPIDFVMPPNTTGIIITGPNTGGKTVALKTVGLFALMNQIGLALPVEDGTTMPVFDAVYADIGDEQSLSQSLSTFSAHITNIASFIDKATAHSLVLLDELGAGTDPKEGSALAMALLDYFIEKKVHLVITTHHGVLKNYGWTHEGIENASVEFDGDTFSPKYNIVMGLAGESRALEIALKSGLQKSIVEKALFYINDKQADLSSIISAVEQKQKELKALEQAHKKEDGILREKRRQVDLKELRLRQKEVELKAAATGRLAGLLTESRKQLENLVREIKEKEGKISGEQTHKVKEFLSDLERTVIEASSMQEEEEGRLQEALRSEYFVESEQGSPLPLEVGAAVLAGPHKVFGTVVRADKKGFWYVEVGSVKMRFLERELQVIKSEKPKASIAEPDLMPASVPEFELKLLGMHVDEALDRLRRQMDASIIAEYKEFSVVHGKGDGVLRRAVHDFLSSHPAVKEFHFSRPEMGGFGRTEVTLQAGPEAGPALPHQCV